MIVMWVIDQYGREGLEVLKWLSDKWIVLNVVYCHMSSNEWFKCSVGTLYSISGSDLYYMTFQEMLVPQYLFYEKLSL